jgi:hypothetical protein
MVDVFVGHFVFPTFPAQLAVSSSFRPDGQYRGSPNHREILIKYLKCPTFDAKRWRFPDLTNETKKMQMSLRKQTKNTRM